MKPADLLLKLDPARDPKQRSSEVPPELSAQHPSVVPPAAFLEMIEKLRECERYDWADRILRGICDTVTASGRVTAAQRDAVLNIRHAGEEREEQRERSPQGGRRDSDGYYRNYNRRR
jgi:hypothetical protein